MPDGIPVKDVADTVRGIVEAVPIYQDAIQPAARELGLALQTVAKTVHIVLAPIKGLVWGFDQLTEFLSTQVAAKLLHVDPTRVITPSPTVAVPALQALCYAGHEPELSDMYANLLATAMVDTTSRRAQSSLIACDLEFCRGA